MSASTAQIEANRANALKSTGPKSGAGKAASSRNATAHGLSAKEIFVRPGEEADFLALEEELTNLYTPENEAQAVFFKILVHSAWNLRRCRQLEAVLQNEANQKGILDPLCDDELARKADRILRHLRSAERSHSKALAELRKLQTERTYRIVYKPEGEDICDEISQAIDMKGMNTELERQFKSRAATTALQLRNRYAPGMPTIFDNEDGTFTAYVGNSKSTIRFTGSMIVDVPGNSPGQSAKAAA